jgi:hypothetical protein
MKKNSLWNHLEKIKNDYNKKNITLEEFKKRTEEIISKLLEKMNKKKGGK